MDSTWATRLFLFIGIDAGENGLRKSHLFNRKRVGEHVFTNPFYYWSYNQLLKHCNFY
jgi:hypothetical protein